MCYKGECVCFIKETTYMCYKGSTYMCHKRDCLYVTVIQEIAQAQATDLCKEYRKIKIVRK